MPRKSKKESTVVVAQVNGIKNPMVSINGDSYLVDTTVQLRIQSSAKKLFFTFGFSRVTMEELAQTLGISKKTLYRYYSTKDDLIREIVDQTEAEMSNYCRSLVESKQYNFIEKHALLGHFIGTKISQQSVAFWSDLERYLPEVYSSHAKKREETVRTHFLDLIQQGIKQKYLRKDVNPHVVMLMFLAVIEGVFKPSIVSTLPLTPESLYTMIIRIIFEGAFPEHGRNT